MKMEALNCWIEIQREAARFNFMQREKNRMGCPVFLYLSLAA